MPDPSPPPLPLPSRAEPPWNAALVARGLATVRAHPGSALVVRDGVLRLGIERAAVLRVDEPGEALDRFAATIDDWARRGTSGGAPAFGWLGYDALRDDEPNATTDTRPRADEAPCAWLAAYRAVLDVDLRDGGVRALGDDVEARRRIERTWNASSVAEQTPTTETTMAPTFSSRTPRDEHAAAIERVREAIYAGDVYLVNLARVLHADGFTSAAWMADRIARARAPRSAWIEADSVRVGAMSMELALRWDRATGQLETRPIKGTRPRIANADVAADEAVALELASDPKERAENVMAVDVHRNDLGRVARAGSVRVDALCEVERHAYVHHLVSRVSAVVRGNVSTADVLRAMLPVGSVTGAPKRAAMTFIANLERERRGIYTGVYGTIEPDGSFDLAVAIRTLVQDARGTHYGVGGGIVADSEAERECDELDWKSRSLTDRA